MRRLLAATVTALALVGGALVVAPAAPAGAGSIGGCQMFPSNTFWHADISRLSRHPQSNQWIGHWPDSGLKMDFGSGLWDGGPIGIPYDVVPDSQPNVDVDFVWYPDESDTTWDYPIPPGAQIEGGPDSDGDRHVLVVEQGVCRLHELYAAYPGSGSSWDAGSGAQWDLTSHEYRGEPGWTSADAAGLPILPALVRYPEAQAGTIDHPLRITVPCTADGYVWPARHEAGSGNSCPPMGAWLRLKPTVDISGFTPIVQNILEALKTYGAIVADNGSAWYVSGVPDAAWDNDDLNDTRSITGSDLEFVDVSTIRVDGGASSTMRYQDRGQRFTDVPPSHPFFEEIGWLVDEEITTGFPDLTFRPGQAVTRQATVAFLHRMAGSPSGPFPDPGFSDVPDGHPFELEVAWAAAQGVVGGFPDGTFRPGQAVTRQAMAAFLYGLADGASDPAAPDPGFSDVLSSHPFFTEIAWLADSGVTGGFPDGTFRGSAAVTRQAMAAFLERVADL